MEKNVKLAEPVIPKNKPTVEEFFWLVNETIGLGYKVNDPALVGNNLLERNFHLSEWVRKRSGPEVDKKKELGLNYQISRSSNSYKAKVWPSFVLEMLAYKKRDHGFALIENELGNAVFWAPPVKRTKNFVHNLLGWSRICLELVHDRPICKDPECGGWMHIYGTLNKGYYWKCINEELHGLRLPIENITVGLSESSRKFLEKTAQRWRYDAKDLRRKSERKGSFGKRRTDKWQGNSTPSSPR